MTEYMTLKEVAGDKWSKRRHRRKEAKQFGYRWYYDHNKNRFMPNVITGSDGLRIEAMVNGKTILWFDTLVRGRYVD